MKEFIYSEMMVHVPLCTNKNPQNVLVISDSADDLTKEIEKHDNINYKVVGCDLELLRDEADKAYDVVLSEMPQDKVTIACIDRILNDDGLLATLHASLDEVELNKSTMRDLANYFKIIMPYSLDNHKSSLLLASKEYHPTADIVLQRSDMLDELDYYNCDVHVASFAMGNYVRKEYLGIIKN